MTGVDTLRLWESGLHRLAVVAVLCLAGACSTTGTAPSQVAERRNGDGIGGTGSPNTVTAAADGKKNGDGIGGTGILGTISGFSSVIVNGIAWEFDRHTAVESDGKPSSLEELKVGQVIQGVARLRGEKYFLDTLEIQHAVTGPIGAVDHAGETMTVLGQKVKLNLAGDKAAIDAFRTLQAGDTVSVSGLRLEDGTIVASRVDEQSKDDGRVLLRGMANVSGASVRIGDLTVTPGADAIVSQPANGAQVFVAGRMINGQFVADVVAGAKALPFGKDVRDVSLEGYAPARANPLSIQGIAVQGALPAGTSAGDRIVVTGHIAGDNTIAATAITKVRTVVTINKANGSLRPAAMRPDTRQRPDRVAPPERPPIDRPQALDTPKPDVVRPTVPERPQIERPQNIGPTS
ncbi:MAG: DUF5666 domain-containing protein [Proteobacteria bacterium]|nr:DUF5666 domain-containing protein [Pseudomonadota bacterium]